MYAAPWTQQTPTGPWVPISGLPRGVSGANSVALTCYIFFPPSGVTFYFDMFYLSKVGAY